MMRPKIVLLACLLTIALPVEAKDPNDPYGATIELLRETFEEIPLCGKIIPFEQTMSVEEAIETLATAIIEGATENKESRAVVYFGPSEAPGSIDITTQLVVKYSNQGDAECKSFWQ